MLRGKYTLIYLIAILFIVFNMMPFAPQVTAAFRYLQEGMTAPEVKGLDILTGEEISSEKLANENIVVITFWATWSNRSIELLRDMRDFLNEHPDKRIKIIAVNVENQKISPEERQVIIDRVTELNLPFPVIIDSELSLFYEYGVIAVPSTAILDTTGILRFAPSGYSLITRDLIIDSVEVLLGLKKPSALTVVKKGYRPANKASRYYRLALQLTNQKMYERALSNLDTAQEADTMFSAVHNLRGQIFLEIDSISAALREFEIAVRLDSTSVAARAGFGRALYLSGQLNAAFKSLSNLHAFDATYTPALLDLALVMIEQQKFSEAADSLRKALELNPRDPLIHYYLGKAYLQSGQNDKAVDSYKTALQIIFPAP